MERGDDVRFVTVEVEGRVTVRVAIDPAVEHTGDAISAWLREHGSISDPPIDLVLSFLDGLDRRGRVVDVGAHIGTISLPANALGHQVLAVEASPRNAQLLRLAVAHDDLRRILVVHAAAADRPGTVPFVAHGPWGHHPLPGDVEAGRTVDVEAVRVDDLVAKAGWDHVDLVKVDIEGGERRALDGMRVLLAMRPAPTWLVECNLPSLEGQGTTGPEMLGVFEAAGYRLHMVDRARPRTLVPRRASDLQVETVADYVASVDEPRIPGWTVAAPFAPGDVVERIITAAAVDDPTSRARAARLLRGLAGDGATVELDLALRTLRVDDDPAVREAAGAPGA
jgi:FkbM family methyltransferase